MSFDVHRPESEIIAMREAFPCPHPEIDDEGLCLSCDMKAEVAQ